MAGDTENIWQNIELGIDPEPFRTSLHISSMNKKAESRNKLKPKVPFKWIFIDIIPETSTKSLTSETTLSNYILIFDAQSKTPKLYGMERTNTE